MGWYKETYQGVLFAYHEKKRRSDKLGAIFVYYAMRPISFYVTPFFVRLNISANGATLIGCGFGVFAFIGLIMGGMGLIFAGVCIIISEILDHVDGNLARYYKTSRYDGKFLDSVGGEFQHVLWVLGLSLGLMRYGEQDVVAGFLMGYFGPEFFPMVGGIIISLMFLDAFSFIRSEHLKALAHLDQFSPSQERSPIEKLQSQAPLATGIKSLPRRLTKLVSELFAPAFMILPLFKLSGVLFLLSASLLIPQLSLSFFRTCMKARIDLNMSKSD